jgi:hypothetical protein
MQIQLKQSEIVTALKQYIAAQGINLNGKVVDITFTASRSAAGIVADIMIDETNVPVINNYHPRADVPVTNFAASAIEAPSSDDVAVPEPVERTASLFS